MVPPGTWPPCWEEAQARPLARALLIMDSKQASPPRHLSRDTSDDPSPNYHQMQPREAYESCLSPVTPEPGDRHDNTVVAVRSGPFGLLLCAAVVTGTRIHSWSFCSTASGAGENLCSGSLPSFVWCSDSLGAPQHWCLVGQTRTGMFLGSSVVARGGVRFPVVLTPAGWGLEGLF